MRVLSLPPVTHQTRSRRMSVRPCVTASAPQALQDVLWDVDIWDQVEAHLHTPRARRPLRRRQVVSERIFADVKVKRDQRVSSTTAQASISTLAPSGSAEVAKAVRAGSDEPKNSAYGPFRAGQSASQPGTR